MTMLFPSSSVPRRPPIEGNKALLLLDFQNDFINTDGKLPVPNVDKFLPKVATLVKKFRSRGPVVAIRTEFSQPRLVASLETGLPCVILEQNLTQGEKKNKRQVSCFDLSTYPSPLILTGSTSSRSSVMTLKRSWTGAMRQTSNGHAWQALLVQRLHPVWRPFLIQSWT
jgi:nicotinamidase-related amidase